MACNTAHGFKTSSSPKNRLNLKSTTNSSNNSKINARKSEVIQKILNLEKIGIALQGRSIKTDMTLGGIDAIVYDLCNRIFHDSIHSGGTIGIGDPVFFGIRSLISDFVLRATTPLVEKSSPSKARSPISQKKAKREFSLIVDLDDIEEKQNLVSQQRNGHFVLSPDYTQEFENISGIYVERTMALEYDKEKSKKQRNFVLAIFRLILLPVIMHSLAHTFSEITTHEVIDGIILVE